MCKLKTKFYFLLLFIFFSLTFLSKVSSQSITLSADDYFVDSSIGTLTIPVTLQTIGTIDVATVTFRIVYDSEVLTPTVCNSVIDIGVCNLNLVDTLIFGGYNIYTSIPNNSIIANFEFDINPNSYDYSPIQIIIINLFPNIGPEVTSFGSSNDGSVSIYCDPSFTFFAGDNFNANVNEEIYNTFGAITAYNNVFAGANISYEAGQYILLDNNFYVDAAANFRAEIKNCNTDNSAGCTTPIVSVTVNCITSSAYNINVQVSNPSAFINTIVSSGNPSGFDIFINIGNGFIDSGFDVVAAATDVTIAGQFTSGTPINIQLIGKDIQECPSLIIPVNANCSCFGFEPSNDDCINATQLSVSTTPTCDGLTAPYTLACAGIDQADPIGSCFNSGINADVWFSFVAPASGQVQISTDYTGGLLTDSEIALYSGTCGNLVEVDCNQDGGTTVVFNSIINATGLISGLTYLIQVDRWGTSSDESFCIDVIDLGCIGYVLPNDDCINATPLIVGAASTCDGNIAPYTLACAGVDPTDPIGSCFNAGLNANVWFSFVAPPNGQVLISTDYTGGLLVDTEIALYSGTCGNLVEVDCDQDGGITISFNSVINTSGLIADDTYFIQVDRWGSSLDESFCIDIIGN